MNKGIERLNISELQNKKIVSKGFRKGVLPKVVVLALAALLMAGPLTGCTSQQQDTISVSETNLEVLGLKFDANNQEEIIERSSSLMIDYIENGYEIEYLDVTSLYWLANINQLSHERANELRFNITSEEGITTRIDKLLIYLKQATMGNREIDIANIFSNKNDATLINKVIRYSDAFEIAETKEQKQAAADEFANFVNDLYNTQNNEYEKYSPFANLVVIRILDGQVEKTINSGYTIVSKDVQDLLWYYNTDACTKPEENGLKASEIEQVEFTIYNKMYSKIKEQVEALLDDLGDMELNTSLLEAIAKKVTESGVKLGVRVDVNEVRDANDNTIYMDNPASPNYVPPISAEEKKNLVTDKNGNTTIQIPQSEAEKKAQQDAINKEIADKAQNTPSADNVQADWQSGYDTGFTTGIAGSSKGSTSGKNENYVKGYDLGYGDGYTIYLSTLTQDVPVSSEEHYYRDPIITDDTTTTPDYDDPYTKPGSGSSSSNHVDESVSYNDDIYIDPNTGYMYTSDGYQILDENGKPMVASGYEDSSKRR